MTRYPLMSAEAEQQKDAVTSLNGNLDVRSNIPNSQCLRYTDSGLAALGGLRRNAFHGDSGGVGDEVGWQPSLAKQQSSRVFAADVQPFPTETECSTLEIDQRRVTQLAPPKRLTCEERRLQLCAKFDAVKFDAMIYAQADNSSPPRDIFMSTAPTYVPLKPLASGEGEGRLYMRLDPRIHWPHNRSERWYEAKMEEIKRRGGRKANFGKAAERMRQQRLEEERQAGAKPTETETAAPKQASSVTLSNDPQPWSHNRPMDFGDVPEQELPAYVRKNEDWLRATAWMRENREKSLRLNEEAAALRAAGKPWHHVLARKNRSL
ncbi:hypothetical protein CCHL11_05823 [Colletotrichum chlorophyti]|uniref:Uncharacterized protein n=1 Tax=Colletotrichum chlorophyti TaxID=708187 RepID=A0A1Q8RMI5_9PEZI|nr:hypothetical protein CCHL11_05823 [Colletotrichum chlorophyti]